MVTNKTRLEKLEDHTKKTDPEERPVLYVVVWEDLDNSELVRFTPPGKSHEICMTHAEFEQKYSGQDWTIIEVKYDRAIDVEWPED